MDREKNEIWKFDVCVASTGVAGSLLPGGQTAHSFFPVPLLATLE
jgi:hypothetical protein